VISPFYDPMIAKVVVHGPTRVVALRKLARALRGTQVAGTVTNLGFLAALAEHEGFAQGAVDTGLIARDLDVLTAPPPVDVRARAQAGLIAAGLWETRDSLTGFALWQPLMRRVALMAGDAPVDLDLSLHGPDACTITCEGAAVQARRSASGWRLDGQPACGFARTGDRITVFAASAQDYRIVDPLERRETAGAGAALTLAPMPGRVVSVHVHAGQAVQVGDRLVVLEAMKMEHSMTAARDGTIAEVLVETGAQVEAGAALIRLQEEDAA
jgi:3-methylcrotonyl-CoA carboxylase alpha subunit